MSRIRCLTLLVVPLVAVAALTFGTTTVFAHARYDRSEPAAGAMVEATPFVLKAWFTQELMLRSTIAVVDEAGNQVDLGDGRVDPDDPDRKVMLVSLPALPTGVYTVTYMASSAEDSHDEGGSFTFGVGVTPPAADTATSPAGATGH